MNYENINGVNRAAFGPERGIKQDETKLSRKELKAHLDKPGMSERAYLERYIRDYKELQELEENHTSPDAIKDTNVKDWFKNQKGIDNLRESMNLQLELFSEHYPEKLPLDVLAEERMAEEQDRASVKNDSFDLV